MEFTAVRSSPSPAFAGSLPLLAEECRRRPQLILVCRSRRTLAAIRGLPGPPRHSREISRCSRRAQAPWCLRWPRPAHLHLRWSRPAHLRLRWSCPAHLRWSRPAPVFIVTEGSDQSSWIQRRLMVCRNC